LDTLFRVVHIGTFNVLIQALRLIYQTLSAKEVNLIHLFIYIQKTHRFYRVLYETLLDPRLASSSKQAMYLNLLYRALKNDTVLPRLMAFIKRIAQIIGYQQAPLSCGALYLISQVSSSTFITIIIQILILFSL
jgi:ribosome biogenesis protein MAK21